MRRRAVLLLTLMTAALMMVASPAWAKDFTVSLTGEGADDDPGDGVCDTGAIPFFRTCTLRAAIEEANANGEADKITFSPSLSGTITLTNGQLQIANNTPATDDLIIEGPGASTLTVSGNDASRVFLIDASADVTISGLTISDGSEGSTLLGSNGGGGIHNGGTLTLTNSTVSGNSAGDFGGGIANHGGTMTLPGLRFLSSRLALSIPGKCLPEEGS